jgi:hypothetical protein
MNKIFAELGWVPSSSQIPGYINNNDTKNYEYCRCVMEGWFPFNNWEKLNQVYAGLGQLLNTAASRSLLLQFVTTAAQDEKQSCRFEDWRKMMNLINLYSTRS